MPESEEEREKRLTALKKALDFQVIKSKFLPREHPTVKLIAEEPEPQIKTSKICRSCGRQYTLSKVASFDPGLCIQCYMKNTGDEKGGK